ncbi:hypothetical protein AB0H82_26290 [Streptomyces sp. NPDC050732]|uniref:hypothetical protein n=1 Tax=Streptomyces sp. NPDC050732 TaxID=3154632 RepID=UPI0034239EEF
MNRKSLRISSIVALTAATVAVAAPMATAAEGQHALQARHAQQTQQVKNAQDPIDLVAAVEEAGFEERLLALPSNPTPQQVVEAMYPGNPEAQEAALPLLDGSNQAFASTNPENVVLYGWWDTTKRVAACVGAVGAFVAGNALLISKAAKYGGVVKGAKLIAQAGNREERLKLAIAIFGNVTGITGMVKGCGG